MTSHDLDEIESTLGIQLPEAYRRSMQCYPFASETPGADYEMPDDHHEVVEWNLSHRREGFYGHPWPATLFTFGHDGGGNHFCFVLTAGTSAVFEYDHETGELEQVAPDLEAWIAERQSIYAKLLQETEVIMKTKSKRWWTFWRG